MLRRSDHLRIVRSLIAEELGRARKRAVAPSEYLRWAEDTPLDEKGVGVDSLDKLDLIERVNEFYNLHEIGSEDYLVIAPTLGGWIDVIEETMRRGVSGLTFRTSGSMGQPTRIDIPWSELTEEIDVFDPIIGVRERVLGWTPPHHLYGFLFSALLPARRDLEVKDGRGLAPSALRRVKPGDLVVATPFLWRRLLDACGDAAPNGAVGLSSGAACPPEVWAKVDASPVTRLIEIYGSTETGGVGWREQGDAPFRLLDHWRRVDGAETLRREGREADDAAPDRLAFEADGRFRPEGRRDRVVQVAGVNVSPQKAVDALCAHPLVAEAAVRPDASDADGRLKAFLVPAGRALDPEALAAIETHIRETLTAPERPATFTIGSTLPRSESGKLIDWRVG